MGGAVVFVRELHAKDIGGSKFNFMNEYFNKFNNILVCQKQKKLETMPFNIKSNLLLFNFTPQAATFDPNIVFFV